MVGFKGRKNKKRIDILAIGSSTGGPDALQKLLDPFPKNFPVPVVIVQHMPASFTKRLAERLDAISNIKVVEAKEGDILEKGTAYLAPGDYHMALKGSFLKPVLTLNQDPPENSCRPAVDVLFRSVVTFYGANTLAVILTGMGKDGLKGCEEVRKAGGQVMVQDKNSSVVWGMPGQVAQSGLAHKILPLDQLTDEIFLKISPSGILT
jgi:two-component system, chemotaxis family, protein-glutamate methylesterase/glutaminase